MKISGTQHHIINYKNISIFKGLNALRFIAAFLVVMHHGEGIRLKNNLPNIQPWSLFQNGGNAVSFFFVLSGFLITYLLLKELNKTGTISISKFYFKRILRIWPLYFLLIVIGTIILPSIFYCFKLDFNIPYSLADTWYYFLFFMPGLVTFYYGHHVLEPLWSIGVEELFYLIWAPLFAFFKNSILHLLLVIIIIKLVWNILAHIYFTNALILYLISTFKFEAMAIGGVGAYLLFMHGKELLGLFIFKPLMQLLISFCLLIYLFFHNNINHSIWEMIFDLPIVSELLLMLLFLYVIIAVAMLRNTMIQWDNHVLNYLGEISYGIYMYHILVLYSILLIFKNKLMSMNIWSSTIFFYFLVSNLIIVVASMSKYYIEDYFLRLKK